jgi:hypothetical protein
MTMCEQCEEKEADYLMVDDFAICLDCLDELTKAMRAKWRAANVEIENLDMNEPDAGTWEEVKARLKL